MEERLSGQGRKSSIPRLKLVEQAGLMIKTIVTEDDPWSSKPCTHPQCSTCSGDKPGDCKTRSVVYSNTCLVCKSVGRDTKYLGETSRTMLERSKEHQADALRLGSTSHMREHMCNTHPEALAEVLTSFRMNIVKKASSPLERQVREAVQISRAKESTLLNRKEEYNRCLLPRMSLEGPKPLRVQEEQHREEVKQLTRGEEEGALLNAKKGLKAKLDQYRSLRGPPGKRTKTSATKSLPGFQLPPTWDVPVETSQEGKLKKGDIRRFLRPLRRCNQGTPSPGTLEPDVGEEGTVNPGTIELEPEPEQTPSPGSLEPGTWRKGKLKLRLRS